MTELSEVTDYIATVRSRAEALTAAGIWSPLRARDVTEWESQFLNENEKILAALILDNLIVRPKKQILSMLTDAISSSNLADNDRHDFGLFEKISKRSKTSCSVLVPVIGRSQAPTKSGPYILRLLQRQWNVKDQYLKWAESALEMASDLNSIILIDDFSGSGSQFEEFLLETELSSIREKNEKIEVTLFCAAIHRKAVNRIERQFPWIRIISADRLDDSHALFSPKSCERLPSSVDVAMLKDAYEKCLERAGVKADSKFSHGFGDLELCYAFDHATPNNSIPLLWYESDTWRPLVFR